jgi:Protein of unknown function (DUF3631)
MNAQQDRQAETGQPVTPTPSKLSARLLTAIKSIFDESEESRLSSLALVERLVAMKGGPWSLMWAKDIQNGRTLGPKKRLAAMLRNYGIRPKNIRLGDKIARGYEIAQFIDEE